MTKTNGKATEIVSVHSGGVNSFVSTVRNSPSYYDSFFSIIILQEHAIRIRRQYMYIYVAST